MPVLMSAKNPVRHLPKCVLLLGALVALTAAPAGEAKLPKKPSKEVKADLRKIDDVLDREIAKLAGTDPIDKDALAREIRKLRDLKDNQLLRKHMPEVAGLNFTTLFHWFWFADRNLLAAQLVITYPPDGAYDSTERRTAREALEKAKKWLKRLRKELAPPGGAKEGGTKPDGTPVKGEGFGRDPIERLGKLIDRVEKTIKELGEISRDEAIAEIGALIEAKRDLLNEEFQRLFGVGLGTILLRFEGMNDSLNKAQEVVKSGDETAIRTSAKNWLSDVRSWKLALEDDLKVGCGFVPQPKAANPNCGPPPLYPPPPLYSTLTVAVSGGAGGAVTVQPPGITCTSMCSISLFSLSEPALVATGNPGSGFSHWTGACAGQGGSCRLTLVGPTATTAVFRYVD